MHSFSLAKNVGNFLSFETLDALTEATSQTNSTKNTDYIDRLDGGLFQSGVILGHIDADAAAAGTVTLKVNLAEASSTTGANLADFGTTTYSVVVGSTASTAAQTGLLGTLAGDVEFTTARRYIRAEWSLTFSDATTGANTARVAVALCKAGFETLPST